MAIEKSDIQAYEGRSEAGQLAEKFGISVFKARDIIDECGDDLDCREAQSLRAQAELKTGGKSTGDL